MATGRPTARCCERCTSADTTSCSSRRMSSGTPRIAICRSPSFCEVRLYDRWRDVLPRVRKQLRDADVAVVGSYFPDGIAAIDEMLDANPPVKAFYDIDTPITLAALRDAGSADYIAARQIPSLDIYFSFTGGPMLREIETRFGAPRAVPLYCSFDPQQYRRLKLNRGVCLRPELHGHVRSRSPAESSRSCCAGPRGSLAKGSSS